MEIMPEETLSQLESRIRSECAAIASSESDYWANFDSETHPLHDIAIGAMGASDNICAAILLGKTVEDHRKDIQTRKSA